MRGVRASEVQVGQRFWLVRFSNWRSSRTPVEVVKCSAARACLRLPHDQEDKVHATRDGWYRDLEPFTKHDVAVEAWEKIRPRLRFLWVDVEEGGCRVRMRDQKDGPPDLRRMAEELLQIDEWMNKRPKKD